MSTQPPEKSQRVRIKRPKSRVTVERDAARALARAARLATVGEITASITHEVNQPLAAILNNAETGLLLFQRDALASELLHSVLKDIRSEALRASAIVRRTRALLQDREIVRDGRLRIEVQDQGRGVDPHERDTLFDPFFTTKPEGMGLGLSLARSIVTLHGGSISLADRAPRGATFIVILPVSGAISLQHASPTRDGAATIH